MIKGEGSQMPDKAELSCTIREKECVANCIKAYAGQQSLIVRLSPFLYSIPNNDIVKVSKNHVSRIGQLPRQIESVNKICRI